MESSIKLNIFRYSVSQVSFLLVYAGSMILTTEFAFSAKMQLEYLMLKYFCEEKDVQRFCSLLNRQKPENSRKIAKVG